MCSTNKMKTHMNNLLRSKVWSSSRFTHSKQQCSINRFPTSVDLPAWSSQKVCWHPLQKIILKSHRRTEAFVQCCTVHWFFYKPSRSSPNNGSVRPSFLADPFPCLKVVGVPDCNSAWRTVVWTGLDSLMLTGICYSTYALILILITKIMKDCQFSFSGYKHPDGVFGSHAQSRFNKLAPYQRRLQTSSKQSRYVRFGTNLGPSRPLIPIGKYTNPLVTSKDVTGKIQLHQSIVFQ